MPLQAELSKFGTPADGVNLVNAPKKNLSTGEVRVRMLAAPINPADINLIQGTYGIKPDLPTVPGLEGCGRVIESCAENIPVGSKVIFLHRVGTWSEEVICSAEAILTIPEEVPDEQAAMLKVNPFTAWCMLTDFVDLTKGSWIIQNAANSGVGTCVIQLAKMLGLKTINLVRREELIPELEQLGADHVLLDDASYIEKIEKLTNSKPPSLALNAVGGDSALRLMDALASKGIHVTYGAMSRRSLKVSNKFLIFKGIELRGFWLTEWAKKQPFEKLTKTYQKLASWMADGKLLQPIAKNYPLGEIKEALEHAQEGKRAGKIMIVFPEK